MSSKARAAVILTLLVATVLCIRQLGEPDVWWQLRTGEYILNHGEVPDTDVFSYTYNGDPWFNVKWGTEVLMALVVRALGPEALMLLQWLVLLGVLGAVLWNFRQLSEVLEPGRGELWNSPGLWMAGLCFLLAMTFRINARPEMMSHLFTALLLGLMLRCYYHPGKVMWWLIPLQWLWANMHEGYGVGMVLMIAFLVWLWLLKWAGIKALKVPVLENLPRFSLVVLLALLSVMIHPMGTPMLWQPFDILGQLSENKFTTELWNFKQKEYWNGAAYLSLGLVLLLLWALRQKWSGVRLYRQVPGYYLLFGLAFLYLTASAQRNFPFLWIWATPVLALIFQRWWSARSLGWGVFFTLAVIFYLAVASGKFYEKYLPVERYGLQVDPSSTPVGAARFIERHQLAGPAFTDYLSSSFYLWYLQPDFKSYLDLRDLDVFEPMFIRNNFLVYTRPETPTKAGLPLFDFMDSLDNFNYVALGNNPRFSPLHRYLNRHEQYALVYASRLTSIYLKRSPENATLLERYAALPLEEKFHPNERIEPGQLARWITRLSWPWYQPEDPGARLTQYRQAYQRDFQ